MPFKDDSPFETRTKKSEMDFESGKEIQRPLLELEDEAQAQIGGQDINEDRSDGEKVELLQEPLTKHVHFSESLQRALEQKELDEELGLNKHDDEDEEEEESTWQDFWEWVKAETKCYANYICPVVLVNACILFLVIMYYRQKN
jgi:hypothetical protein